jgi:hypothetical protein
LGDHAVPITFGANVAISFGSANSWNVPMTEKMTVSSSAGRTAGILIDQAIRGSDAPSTRAAS